MSGDEDGRATGVDRHLTVVASPELLATRARRALAATVVALAAAAIGGTPVVDELRPRAAPSPVGREKVEDDARRAKANFADGSAAAVFEGDLRARSAVRALLAPYYAAAVTRWLGGGETERMLVGRDGWLFLRHRAFPWSSDPHRAARYPGALVAALSHRLKSVGVELTVIPIPRTVDVAADRLYAGADRVGAGFYEATIAEMRRGGVRCADILSKFRELTRPHDAFLRTDSHWSPLGANIAAEEAAKVLGAWREESRRDTVIRPSGRIDVLGDLAKIVGFVGQDGSSIRRFVETVDDYEVRIASTGRRAVRDVYWAFGPDMIVGTSFSRQSSRFPACLRHYTGTDWSVAALNGLGPVEPMRKVLEEAPKRGWPKRIVWEFPAHEFHCVKGFGDDLGEVVARLPADALDVVPGTNAVAEGALAALLADGRPAAGRPASCDFGRDEIACPGDGPVSLRLRGRVSGGAFEVSIRGEHGRISAHWSAGTGEIVLPLVDAGRFRGGRVALRPISGKPTMTLRSADFVAAYGAAVPLAGPVGRGVESAPASRGAHGSGGAVLLSWSNVRPESFPLVVRTSWTEGGAVRSFERTVDSKDVRGEQWPAATTDAEASIRVEAADRAGRVLAPHEFEVATVFANEAAAPSGRRSADRASRPATRATPRPPKNAKK
jgi:alginate O-acetyltransferase complex protein AlgJ